MRKILLILSILFIPSFSFSAHYSHIQTAICIMNELTTQNKLDIANYYDMFFFSRPYSHDLSSIWSTNPNMIIMRYIGTGGNTIYLRGDSSPYNISDDWSSYKTWCTNNSKEVEDTFWHYRTDGTPTEPTGVTTSTLLAGFSVGLIPGWIEGSSPTTGSTATSKQNSRLWSHWATPRSRTLTISTSSGAVRSSNTVTITTTANHNLEIGDRVTVSAVDDTSFNGSFNVGTVPTGTTFTYSQSGSDVTSQNGSVAFYFGRGRYINYKSAPFQDYLPTLAGTLNESFGLQDTAGNKLNGYFFDSIQNQVIHATEHDISQTQEYYDDAATDAAAWLQSYINPYLDSIKAEVNTWLAGARTAYTAVNSDHIDYTGANPYLAMYQHNGQGADILFNEVGYSPGLNDPNSFVQKMMNIYKLMEDYNKIVVNFCHSLATIISGLPTWTNYSGNIWYTDFFDTKIAVYNISGTTGSASTVVTSLGNMVAGSLYNDSSTGRMYLWFNDSSSPVGQQLLIYGGEKIRHLGMAYYYCFGKYSTFGYYAPHNSGATWTMQPHSYVTWHDSITHDIGQPANGGIVWNGSVWTVGNDLWGNALSASSRAFEFWRGNSTTGVAGVWNSDDGVALDTKHRIYARKFDNGYALFRPRSSYQNDASNATLTRPVTLTLPFLARRLRGDGSLDNPSAQLTIRQSEGVILITNIGQAPSLYGIQSQGASFR